MQLSEVLLAVLLLHFSANFVISSPALNQNYQEKIDLLFKEVSDLKEQDGAFKEQFSALKEQFTVLEEQNEELRKQNTVIIESIGKLSNNMTRHNTKAEVRSFAQANGFGLEDINEKLNRYEIKRNESSLFGYQVWSDVTLLHIAVLEGEKETVSALLMSPEIDVNSQCARNYTPLHFATQQEETEILQSLLKHAEIDVNVKTRQGYTPLHLAAAMNAKCESLKQLLSHPRIDVNMEVDGEGQTALHFAANLDSVDCLKELLSNQEVNVNIKDRFGHAPFFFATNKNTLKLFLEDSRVDLDITTLAGKTFEDMLKEHEATVAEMKTDEDSYFWTSQDIKEREKQKKEKLEELKEMSALLQKYKNN